MNVFLIIDFDIADTDNFTLRIDTHRYHGVASIHTPQALFSTPPTVGHTPQCKRMFTVSQQMNVTGRFSTKMAEGESSSIKQGIFDGKDLMRDYESLHR